MCCGIFKAGLNDEEYRMKSGYCWTRAVKEDRSWVPSSVMRGTARGAARMREKTRTRSETERRERQDLCGLVLSVGGSRTAVGAASLNVGTVNQLCLLRELW